MLSFHGRTPARKKSRKMEKRREIWRLSKKCVADLIAESKSKPSLLLSRTHPVLRVEKKAPLHHHRELWDKISTGE